MTASGERAPDPVTASTVRPYLITGGRTTSSGTGDIPLETLVRAAGDPLDDRLTRERRTAALSSELRSIVELTSGRFLSVAELSAHVHLPVPVVRVVLDDLSEQGLVRLHPPEQVTASNGRLVVPRHLLERVLDGLDHG